MASDSSGEAAAVPVGWSINDPIGMKGFRGRGREAKVQRSIALHVAQSVLPSARVNAWNFAVDGQVQAVAQGSKAVWIRIDLVLQEVAQQWEGRTVRSFRVRGYVNG